MGKFAIVQLNPVAVMYTSSSLNQRQQSSHYRRQWESLFTETTRGHPTDLSSTLPETHTRIITNLLLLFISSTSFHS